MNAVSGSVMAAGALIAEMHLPGAAAPGAAAKVATAADRVRGFAWLQPAVKYRFIGRIPR